MPSSWRRYADALQRWAHADCEFPVGLFGIGPETYWSQFADREERLPDYIRQVAVHLESRGRLIIPQPADWDTARSGKERGPPSYPMFRTNGVTCPSRKNNGTRQFSRHRNR